MDSEPTLSSGSQVQATSLQNDLDLGYVHRATADNTRTAYQSDIRHFQQWGGKLPTDVATVIRYCEAHAQTLNPRTLKRRLVALKQFHRYLGFSDPTDHPLVNKTLKGIFNTHGRPKAQASPLLLEHVHALLDHLDTLQSLSARRDSAMIALGFFAALRGGELVNVQAEYIAVEAKGMVLKLPRSKTDPTGEGQACAVPRLEKPYCPIHLIERWQAESGIYSGYLFPKINRWQQCASKPMTTHGLNRVLRYWASEVGLPNASTVSSHSLRRGLATSASTAGASFKSIMRQGRWRHEGTVLEYIEAGQQFNDNAVAKLFNPNSTQ